MPSGQAWVTLRPAARVPESHVKASSYSPSRTSPRELKKGEQLDVILLDFSKAFDKVPHQCLLYKIQHYRVQGPVLQRIGSFFFTRGVPQGSVLGPLLFLPYINGMPAKVVSTLRFFVDDSLMYSIIKQSRTQGHKKTCNNT